MRRLAARSVGHREEVVRGESAEPSLRDRNPDDRAEHDVGEVVDAQVDPQRPGDRDRDRRRDLRPEPRPAGDDEHERHADPEERGRADRDRRSGIAFPARELLHPERPRPERDELEPLQEGSGDAERDDPDHEVAPAMEPRRGEHEEQTERREPDAGTDRVRLLCEGIQPPRADRDHRVGDRRVEPIERTRVGPEPEATGDDDGHERDQPDPAGVTDLLGQGRRGPGRTTTTVRGDRDTGRRARRFVLLIHASPPARILARSAERGFRVASLAFGAASGVWSSRYLD